MSNAGDLRRAAAADLARFPLECFRDSCYSDAPTVAQGLIRPGPDAPGMFVLLNNGDGTFAAPMFLPVLNPGGPVIGDLNGDGKVDLVTSTRPDGYSSPGDPTVAKVAVLLGNGDATFQPEVDYVTTLNASSVFVADFTGSTRPSVGDGLALMR